MTDYRNFAIKQLDWQKMAGLIPAIMQHAQTGEVLMLGYMNEEALRATVESGQATFYSRSQQRLWRKGETSGNRLNVVSISSDCDNDSLLLQVLPQGPTCHLGTSRCFQHGESDLHILSGLIQRIQQRAEEASSASYTVSLLQEGKARCAQKVGEEAVETVIAALSGSNEDIINECADLIYHILVLLQICTIDFYQILHCLKARSR